MLRNPSSCATTSAVELTQRAEAAGIIQRRSDPHDGRVIHLVLTRKGSAALSLLSAQHIEELARLADDFQMLWAGLDDHAGPAETATARRA